MGFDLNELWGQAKEKIEEGWEQAKKVGEPAIRNAAEQWGANVLKEQAAQLESQNKDTQKQLAGAVKEVIQTPSQPGSFGSFFSQGLQGAALQNYGLYIVIGLIAVGVGGYVLMRK